MTRETIMLPENQTRITEAYNASAKTYAERCYHELDDKPLDRLLLDRFSALVPAGGLVCDMGCGPGEIADYLHKKGMNVVGIDIADRMIQEAQRLNPVITFMTGDMTSLSLPEGHFTGICSFYAIVNFREEEIEKILREYHRVLKNDGILFLAFHTSETGSNAEIRVNHTDDFFDSKKSLDFYYLDEETIIGSLKENGFTIKEALVRHPYPEEYPTKRAYILAVKK
ncbi:MAG: methyltransferase domain-containing protein [Methanomicrobiales archaeon]|nr:methyltransferase domain-containing protein [Methanomicrobiales archaeon]